MRKVLKKFFSVMLIVTLCLSSAPLQGIAELDWPEISIGEFKLPELDFSKWFSSKAKALESSGSCGDNVTYTFDSTTGKLVISGEGAMTNYSSGTSPFYDNSDITSVVIEDGVTTIGDCAFYCCGSLTSITIPESVTTIDKYTFYYCNGLTNINIPESVTTIGYAAFSHCTSLTSITIPESVMTIGYAAFSHCTSLTSITIPKSVTTIGDSAFSYCSSLTSINIPESVTTIGECAFSYCSSLTSINIPESVTTIGESPFYYCNRLTSIMVDENNKYYESDENGVLFNKGKTVLIEFPQGSTMTDYDISESVTTIDSYAFDRCTGLTRIDFPESLTTIGSYAFRGCTGLTTIDFSESLTTIGEFAFSGCTGLTTIALPESLTTIGQYAFSGCTGLTTIDFSESLTTIGSYAFRGCTGLTRIDFPESLTTIGSYAFYGCTGLTTIDFSESLTTIGNSAFYGCKNLSEFNYPKNWSSVGDDYTPKSPFVNCTSLTEITIPEGVTTIPAYAFRDCSSLKTVNFPESLTTIGSDAFNYCTGLTTIDFPESLTTIGGHAFYGCTGLTRIDFSESLTTIGSYAFCRCTGLTTIDFPESLTTIDNSAFSVCTGLITIDFPESLTTIDNGAFSGCTGLTRIDFPESLTTIDSYAFEGCINLSEVNYPKNWSSVDDDYVPRSPFVNCTSLTEITIPEGVTTIPAYAFRDCSSLKTVNFPESLTTIGNYAFSGCTGLTRIDFPESLTTIDNSAFSGCTGLTRIDFPESLTTIANSAFSGCTGLTTIDFPESLTTISAYAFYGCINLSEVNYPKNWSSMGNSTSTSPFINCTSLTEITIPEGVTTIPASAFSACSSLKTVNFPESLTSIGIDAFYGCTGLTTIDLPESLTTINRYAFDGCTGLTSITIVNKDCKIYDSEETIYDGAVIYGYSGSTAEEYANKYNRTFKLITEKDDSSTSGSSVAGTYTKNNSFTITPKQSGYNEGFFVLKDVTAMWGNTEITGSDNKFEIVRSGITAENVVLQKEGFRDYIIPHEAVSNFSDGKNFDAYMTLDENDGKPYISSVFARNSSESEYQDLFKTPMVAENDNTYDIIVSGVGLSSDAVYYISQDATHKISSTTGIFNSEDLYSQLALDKTVYVYAVDHGNYTDLEILALKKSNDDGSLKKILNMSTYSLGGSGGITVKIPDENPLFGNSTISLNAFSAPITVYYDSTNDTYIGTIGFDLYGYAKNDKTVTNQSGSLTKFGDGETKKAFENFKESFSFFNNKPFADDDESYKEQWDSFVNRCKTASKYSTKNKDKNFSVDFLGYLEFAVTERGFIVKAASLKVGTKFSYSYTYQGAIWVIPTYFKTTFGASASLEGSGKRAVVDSDIPFEYEITLDIAPEIALEAGVGVEKLAKAGVEAKGSAPLKVEFVNKHLTLKFLGEINIKTKAFIFTWDKKICEGELDVVDYYWGTSKTSLMYTGLGVPQYYASSSSDAENQLVEYYNESTVVDDRNYADDTSEWLDNGIMTLASEESEVTVKQLQTSVYESGKPISISFGDKVLMAWIEDCSDRDTYNRMRLMYSVYNGTSWSTPVAVYDDGKNDDAPVLATDGENVYFAWQKINAVLDENSVVTDALQQVDICIATYNATSESITDAKIICSDNGYDYAQKITLIDGEPVVYFANCGDASVTTSYNNMLNKYENEETTTLLSSLSFVQSISADGEDMSFIIDTDGDLATTNDINVFSYDPETCTEFDKQEITSAVVDTYYGYIDDEKVMFVTDGENIYFDYNGERCTIFEESQNLSSLNLIENNGMPAFMWTSETEIGNEICYSYYDGAMFTTPVVITEAEGYYFDDLNVVNYNGNLVGVFMQDELTYNTEEEAYEITQVNLAYITINDYKDLKLGSIFVEEEQIVPGETVQICVYVKNLGTQTINDVQFTLSDLISDAQVSNLDIELMPGESKNIYVDYCVPENFAQTSLTVTAAITDETDIDTSNNAITETIGKADIRTDKIEYAVNGDNYIVTVHINNNSVTDATNITTRLYLNEKDGENYHEAKIETLGKNETGYIQFVLIEELLTFDENNVAKVYFVAESENTKYGKTVSQCLLITKSETVCGHPETVTSEKIEPDCTTAGKEAEVVCIVCGEVTDGGEEIPATGHTSVADPAVTPTCTSTGLTEGSHCKICSAVIVAQTVTGKLAHTEETVPAVAATCTENGLTEGKKCSVCGETLISQTETDKLSHSYSLSVTNPTCTEKGYTTNTCSVCGDSFLSDEKAALGHTLGSYSLVSAPTCTSDGYEVRECSRCSYYETRTVGTTGHTDVNGDGYCDDCSRDLSPSANCGHMCHKTGFLGFIWKIVLFFQKLFGMNPTCECGAAHW